MCLPFEVTSIFTITLRNEDNFRSVISNKVNDKLPDPLTPLMSTVYILGQKVKCFVCVTKTIANLARYSRKPENYNYF